MTAIRTVLVHIDFHETPPARVKLAANLASRFDARLIGLSAAQMPMVAPSIGRDRFAQLETAKIEGDLETARNAFMELTAGSGAKVDWYSAVGSPTRMIADHAFEADVIVACSHGSDLAESDVGDLVMIAGRPVLVPAPDLETLGLDTIIVAWSNSREARRAVADAMPLLEMAKKVVVVSITKDGSTPKDAEGLHAHLVRHDVKAGPLVIKGDYRHVGDILLEHATSLPADLIVAGAYGHSRIREIAFGGATHDLLHQAKVSLMLSN